MKGLVVISDACDIAFYSVDREFEKYVVDRIKGLEEAAGAQAEDRGSYTDVRDALGVFFLPFNTSFGVLNTLKKPVLAISTEDGFLIVFRKFGEDVYIAVGRSQEDSEESLTRKLFVFNGLIGLLYGPVDSCLSTSNTTVRKKIWQKLSGLLMTYERLYKTDQVFLLEAVEHVQFGQIQAAQDVVVKVAKESLDSSTNGGLPNVQHAMLLVNSKLLTICGKSPQLPTSDILLMTLFVSHHFSEPLFPPEEESPESSPEQEEQVFPEEMDSNTIGDEEEADEADGLELFQTPRTTPASGPSRDEQPDDPFEMDDPQYSIPRDSVSDMEEQFKTPSEEVEASSLNPKDVQSSVVGGRGLPAKLKSLMSIGGFGKRTLTVADADGGIAMPTDSKAKYVEELVFLQPNHGTFIPHTLHCLEIHPGIVLVLITELSGGQLAGTICQTLLNLSHVFNTTRGNLTGGLATFDILEDAMRRINDSVKREVQATASTALSQLSIRVQNVWFNLKSAGFKPFLERGQSPTDDARFTRLEACGRDLMVKLVGLFEKLYFTPKQREYDTNQVLSRLTRNFSNLRTHYGEFLALKGLLNIPMVSFSQLCPGMVHFILIDRSFDEMTTPSISSEEDVGIPYVEKVAQSQGEGAGAFLHKRVWRMVERVQRFLALGYTSQTWLDRDFLYSYYLWINIPNSVLGAPIKFFSPSNVRATEHSPPGVIGTSFYSDIYHGAAQSQGYVYELYCIHESSVPIKVAATQCRVLAEQLWPSSKEAIAPFSLIN